MVSAPASHSSVLKLAVWRGVLVAGHGTLLLWLGLLLAGCDTKEASKPEDPPPAPSTAATPTENTAPTDTSKADDNSDFEILSTDKKKKTITFRDKKTGKTETLSTEAFYKLQAEREKARAKEVGNSAPKYQPGVKEATPEDLPAWVALYAGAEVSMNLKAERDGRAAGRISMTTTDPPDTVRQFYEKQLKDNGFTTTALNSGDGRAITARRESGETVMIGININSTTKKTTIMLTYATK